MPTQILGNQGEVLAKKFLLHKGYAFVAQNYRTKVGEVDLIFSYKDCIVFVEVKTRMTVEQGIPEEAVTPWKIGKIERVAQEYLLSHDLTDKLARIDVIAIEYVDDKPVVRHHENVTG